MQLARPFVLIVTLVTLIISTPRFLCGQELVLGEGVELSFASAAEGAEILQRPDMFVRAMSAFDRSARLRVARSVTVKEYRDFASAEAREWSDEEKKRVRDAIDEISGPLSPYLSLLPARIALVKTSGVEEGGAAYCREEAIAFPERMLARGGKSLQRLFVHELFHILSRKQIAWRRELYELLGFRSVGEVVLPESLRDLKLTNPDAPLVDVAIRLELDGETVEAAPLLFSKSESYDEKDKKPFFAYLSYRLIVVAKKEDGRYHAVLQDGKPRLINPKEQPSFWKQIGRNTNYILHPEEILADNFVALVFGKRELPNPEIVRALAAKLLGRVIQAAREK